MLVILINGSGRRFFIIVFYKRSDRLSRFIVSRIPNGMLKSFTTILLLGAAKALTVDDVSDLQVEFVHGISSSATEWYPSYVSSDNSNKTLTSGNDDGEGLSLIHI